ncbi:MAG: hypothetical protein HY903_07450 [Deltaproteobacteria bacterium]|nr:hypothetical protein [Deltaproteobacteria bacterium]
MFPLLVAVVTAAVAPPVWRLSIHNETTKTAQQVEAQHGAKLKFKAGSWSCELSTFKEDADGGEVVAGRFTLTRLAGFVSCARTAGKDTIVVTASSASCSTVETPASAAADVREFANALVQRAHGAIHLTLSSGATTTGTASERFSVDGGCFRPGLPPPPMVGVVTPPPPAPQ